MRYLGVLRWVILLALVAFGVWIVWVNRGELAALEVISWWYSLGIAASFWFSVSCLAVLNRFALRTFSVELPYREALGLSAVSALSNFALPFRGGTAM